MDKIKTRIEILSGLIKQTKDDVDRAKETAVWVKYGNMLLCDDLVRKLRAGTPTEIEYYRQMQCVRGEELALFNAVEDFASQEGGAQKILATLTEEKKGILKAAMERSVTSKLGIMDDVKIFELFEEKHVNGK